MPHVDGVVAVTIAIFMAGVIFDAGQKSARLTALEQGRTAMLREVQRLNDKLDLLLERRGHARDAQRAET